MATGKPMVVVTSWIKEIIRGMNLRSDGTLPEAVNNKIVGLLKAAGGRAKANKRGTVRPHDL